MAKINCIALIDDDPTTNFINKRVILKNDLANEVLVFLNGKEAIDYLNSDSLIPSNTPSLIFLDINMPIMNGFEFLEAYKLIPHANKAEQMIVMLSSSNLEQDSKKALDLNVDTYLNKPLSEHKIIDVITKINAQS